MFAPWENTSLHFLTIDSEFKELIYIECKTSRFTWKLEIPQVQTSPTINIVKTKETMKDYSFAFVPFFFFFNSLVIFNGQRLLCRYLGS